MNYEMFHQLSFIDEGQKGQHSLNGGNVGASALVWALFLYGLAYGKYTFCMFSPSSGNLAIHYHIW